MNNVVPLNEAISLHQTKKDLTSEEYESHLSSIKSMPCSDIEKLQEQNDRLIKFLEGAHYAHDKYRSELLQLKETVSDLSLDLEDERVESRLLRDKLFSVSAGPEGIKSDGNISRPVDITTRLEQRNQQLMIRLQESEKKHAASREELILSKHQMLKQIKDLKAALSTKESPVIHKQSEASFEAWKQVSVEMPVKSGIYLLSDGIHQCVGYFNSDLGEFAKTTYFSIPTHWMARPNLPS